MDRLDEVADRDYNKSALNYVNQVIDGTIVASKWTILAAKRFLKFMEECADPDSDLEYRPDKVTHFCTITEQMVHTVGRWDCPYIDLLPWQCFVAASILGFYYKKGPRKGWRMVLQAYLEVARKNGKSKLMTALALYMLLFDGEPGARVMLGAVTDTQVEIIFGDIVRMAENELFKPFVEAFGIEVFAEKIIHKASGSNISKISCQTRGMDGFNVSFCVLDEVHEQPNRDLYDAIQYSMTARKQPLLLMITTAGVDFDSFGYDQHLYSKKVLSGEEDDRSFFPCIWAVDDQDKWMDPTEWLKANPSWGVSVLEDQFITRFKRAVANPSEQRMFKTKSLNIWVSDVADIINVAKAATLIDETMQIEEFKDNECWMGVDLGETHDTTGKVIGKFHFDKVKVKRGELEVEQEQLFLDIYCQTYIPFRSKEKLKIARMDGWIDKGFVKTMYGTVTDFDYIYDEIEADAKTFNLQSISFDPWRAHFIINKLMGNGYQVDSVKFDHSNTTHAFKELIMMIETGRIRYNSPVFLAHLSNTGADQRSGAIKPVKKNPHDPGCKIDLVAALVVMMSVALSRIYAARRTFNVTYTDPTTFINRK